MQESQRRRRNASLRFLKPMLQLKDSGGTDNEDDDERQSLQLFKFTKLSLYILLRLVYCNILFVFSSEVG